MHVAPSLLTDNRMKLIISIILTLLCNVVCFGVSRTELNRQIDNANELRSTDCRSSITPLYALFEQASENEWNAECARTLAYIGWAMYDCRYSDLAMQVFNYAKLYVDNDDTKVRDLISLGFGACYASKGEYAKGESQLLRSLAQSRKADNRREQMMIYTYLGDLYSSQAKDLKAKDAFEKGIALAHSLKDTIFESALYCNIGVLCADTDTDEAERYLFKSIDLSQLTDNKTTECYAYINLSELYFNTHQNAKALKTAEQINRFVPDLKKNDRIIAYSHNLLSMIYADAGDYTSAYSQMALASKQQASDYTQIEKERAGFNEVVIKLVKQCETSRLRHQHREQFYTMNMLVVLILAALFMAVVFYLMYRKARKQRKLLLMRDDTIENLEQTSSRQTDEISDTRHTMNYLYGFYRGRNELLEKLSQMVKDSYKMNSTQLPAQLRNINHTITQGLTRDKEPEFVTRLETENEAFVKRLVERYPGVSKLDIMLATCYRLGLSTRDISRLTGKLPTTVTTARYRLRTSLNIPEDADLTEFFNAI